jgi:hypothetical protein
VAGGADGLALAGDAAQDPVDVGAVDRLALQQQVGQTVQCVAVLGQHAPCSVLGLAQQFGHFLVDDPLGRLGIGAAADLLPTQEHRASRGEPDRAQGLAHAELPDHPHRQIGRPRQVVGGAGGGLTEHDRLGHPAAHADRQRVLQVALAVEMALVDGELLGHPQGLARGQDGHLGHRVPMLGNRGHDGVAGLMHRDRPLLVRQQGVGGVAAPQQDPVPRLGEVDRHDHIPAGPDREDGRLVDQVGQIGP